MVKCSNCGTENKSNAVFCQNCGKKLTHSTELDGKIDKEKKGNIVVNFWNNLTTGKKVVILIAIGCLFVLSLGAYVAPLSANSYESETMGIYDGFTTITEDRAIYSTAKNPWYEDEPKIKHYIKKLDDIENKGFPSQYKEFHNHFKNAIENYLLWQNTANDQYRDQYIQEMKTAQDSFNQVSVHYEFKSNNESS